MDGGLQAALVSEGYDMQNMRLLGHEGGFIQAVAAEENYVYFGLDVEFVVLDVSNPSYPIEVGSLMLAGGPKEMQVAGDYVYLIDGATLRVIDVSLLPPYSPPILGGKSGGTLFILG